MPRYDYDCAACATRFEVVHGVHAEPPTSCPSCGSRTIKKAFAPPTIHFKGSGWAKKERRATAASGTSKSTDDASATSRGGEGDPSGSTTTATEPTATATSSSGSSSATSSPAPSGSAASGSAASGSTAD